MSAYLTAHQKAYGIDLLRPKHHYCLHSCMHAQEAGRTFVDCFVHERKHKAMKRCASEIHNPKIFEASTLGRILLEQWRQIISAPPTRGLIGGSAKCSSLASSMGVAGMSIGKTLKFDGLHVGVNDIVLFGDSAGKVVACATGQGRYFLVLDAFRRLDEGLCSSTWTSEVVKRHVAQHTTCRVFFWFCYHVLSTMSLSPRASWLRWSCLSIRSCCPSVGPRPLRVCGGSCTGEPPGQRADCGRDRAEHIVV